MDPEILRLRRDVRILKLYSVVLTSAALIALLAAFRTHRPDDQILRARGLVIVDAAGRERILIGAPIPAATNRVRTDTARVRRTWGPQFPKQYLTWYQTYRNSMNGMLVLDEHGFDRVAIGDSVPDPNIGRRIGAGTGMVINDAQGFERSGYNLITYGGHDRIVMGLDDNSGGEGVTLAVIDSGRVGVGVHHGRALYFLGTAPAGTLEDSLTQPFNGLFLKDGAAERRVTASSRHPR